MALCFSDSKTHGRNYNHAKPSLYSGKNTFSVSFLRQINSQQQEDYKSFLGSKMFGWIRALHECQLKKGFGLGLGEMTLQLCICRKGNHIYPKLNKSSCTQ